MENQCIEACQRGELNTFGTLYEKYVKNIYQFIYFKVHQKELAEDLTSTTFMKALKNIKNFNREKASFKTWLYQIARNAVIDHYRSNKQTSDLEDAWGVSDDTNIERDTDFKMKIEAVQEYMKKLKPEQREVILLRVWGEHSFKEVAQIMGKTEASCKMSFKRVMVKLNKDFTPLLALLLLLNK